MKSPLPIGVFDSGIGGLTVLKEIAHLLPNESLIYLGDTARVPYGTKSRETIVRYSLNNARFLHNLGVKMIVVACNTASAYALHELQGKYAEPVIGVVEGGVAAAGKATKGKVGVIGTEATIRSGSYCKEIQRRFEGVTVVSKPCPLFVALVEEGWIENDVARAVAREYLEEMKGKIDTLVLGCTHYPLLKKVIGETLGSGTGLIDSARETALIVERKLSEMDMKNGSGDKGSIRFMVTDSPERSLSIGGRILGENMLSGAELVDIS